MSQIIMKFPSLFTLEPWIQNQSCF